MLACLLWPGLCASEWQQQYGMEHALNKIHFARTWTRLRNNNSFKVSLCMCLCLCLRCVCVLCVLCLMVTHISTSYYIVSPPLFVVVAAAAAAAAIDDPTKTVPAPVLMRTPTKRATSFQSPQHYHRHQHAFAGPSSSSSSRWSFE